MAYYLSREFVCDRLRLGLRQSYRLLPSCYEAMISSDDVLALLNNGRRMIGEPFLNIPSDIMTAEELASIPELANSGVTARKILAWTRREKKIPPHIYANSHTIRFSRQHFIDWLQEGSRT